MSLTLIVHVHFALLCGLLPSLPAPVLTGVLLYSAIFFCIHAIYFFFLLLIYIYQVFIQLP